VGVEGYSVPKDSFALASLAGFMQDPAYWHRPQLFRPERFLERGEAGGWRLVKRDQFVPFGFGRRVCMGETLARDTLLVFLATLVKHLRFDPPAGHPLPDPANYTDGFTVIPHPYHVSIRAVRDV
jgi:cytochrome P450